MKEITVRGMLLIKGVGYCSPRKACLFTAVCFETDVSVLYGEA